MGMPPYPPRWPASCDCPIFRCEHPLAKILVSPLKSPFINPGSPLLSDVQLTGTRIDRGAYGRVNEVAFSVAAAVKTVYAFLQESDGTVEELPKAASQFVRECQLMGTLHHPNIVQFLGVTFFPGSQHTHTLTHTEECQAILYQDSQTIKEAVGVSRETGGNEDET